MADLKGAWMLYKAVGKMINSPIFMYIVYQQIYFTKCLFIFSCRGMWTKEIVHCAPWGRRLFGCLPKFSCTWEVNSVHCIIARSTWFNTTSSLFKGVRKNAKSNMPFLLRKHASPLISRTCGILWDSEGLNWLRWTCRNILPRTIALNKWINEILFVLWLICLFCLFVFLADWTFPGVTR